MIIALISVTVTLSISAVIQSNDHLRNSIAIQDDKIEIVTKMRTFSRERTVALTQMLTATDDETIERLQEKLDELGGRFVEQRDLFTRLDLNEGERAILMKHGQLANYIVPIQREFVDLILFDQREEAMALLINEAIPQQSIAFTNLTELIILQRRDGGELLNRSQESFDAMIRTLWLMFASIVGLTILIIWFVFKVISRNEVLQRTTNLQLERLVADRTEELTRSRDEAIAANLAAQEANRAKSEFLSRMSHELRTPLNAILGFSSLISRSQQSSDETREQVDHIHTAGDHLLHLVDEILDLSRIESGKLLLDLKAVRLTDVLIQCRLMIEPMLKHYEIDLQIDHCYDQSVLADPVRLEQTLINLLTNAIKYNRRGGRISVHISTIENETLRISITDTGIGIDPDHLQKLFEPFERLNREDREIEGTGIGLSISKQLVEMMGGHIGVSSERGVGSTFWVDLRIATPEQIDTTNLNDPDLNTERTQRKQIVYIEDNSSNRRLMEEIISQMTEHELRTAEDGNSGLDLIFSTSPDIALIDIDLPDIDGFDILRRLRSDERTRDLTVIALSANAMPEQIKAGMAAGFDNYLTKPFDVDSLISKIESSEAA